MKRLWFAWRYFRQQTQGMSYAERLAVIRAARRMLKERS